MFWKSCDCMFFFVASISENIQINPSPRVCSPFGDPTTSQWRIHRCLLHVTKKVGAVLRATRYSGDQCSTPSVVDFAYWPLLPGIWDIDCHHQNPYLEMIIPTRGMFISRLIVIILFETGMRHRTVHQASIRCRCRARYVADLGSSQYQIIINYKSGTK